MTHGSATRPTISVIMANYNGEPYLRAAVESILFQTFDDFEFIVIDDCSTDKGFSYLTNIDDPRMIVIRNQNNQGQTASLNIGLARACGEFIARMDSDDITMPNRFERQVTFLRENPEIDIVGSQAILIDGDGNETGRTRLPEDSQGIWAYSILQSPFIHPSVMIRGSMVWKEGVRFDENYINQDFELWSRLLINRRGANIADPLIHYRVHRDNMTSSHQEENLHVTVKIIERRLNVEGLHGRLSREDIDKIIRYFLADRRLADDRDIDRLALARIYWDFCHTLFREGRAGKTFRDLIVYRVFQSGIWPKGIAQTFGRFQFFVELFAEAPGSVARLFTELPRFCAKLHK